MKALGEAALDLPWLPPCAASLITLTRASDGNAWQQVRHDPGAVLLMLRACPSSISSFSQLPGDPRVLAAARHYLQQPVSSTLADWHRPGLYRVVEIAIRQAALAAAIARETRRADPEQAWIAGLLAPLGWLAVGTLDAERLPQHLARLVLASDGSLWQQSVWGLDAGALTRRLARNWRLPDWLATVIGHLGLGAGIAEQLGAEPKLFQSVQLAVAWLQQREGGLRLPVGAAVADLLPALGVSSELMEHIAERAWQALPSVPVPQADLPPALLGDMLRMAQEQCQQTETIERLQRDLDRLQQALERQSVQERDRLHAKKLMALAEMAAGAGHEINNPLAVISGQAQYLLKQIELAEEQLVEDPSPTLYLDTLKTKLNSALSTIVGQAHRIHHVLTDLMQFARPPAARPRAVAVARLVSEAVQACTGLAQSRKVRLLDSDLPADLAAWGDATQLRTALVNLFRNAVEAAPENGWAAIKVQAAGSHVDFIVEDNGPGPAPVLREHLFDPFFCGRSAGRGRGLGLPTAWRLAQHNGGDVQFAGVLPECTRFVLRTLAAQEPALTPSNGNGSHAGPRSKSSGLAAAPLAS